MKYFIFTCSIVFMFLFNSNCFAEELVKFDKNDSSTVYLIKKSLIQESENVRTVWVRYDYTKLGSDLLKTDIKTSKAPSYSKVKYGFDCTSDKHKVFIAAIYDHKGIVIKHITNGQVESVIPGTVGEAIRNFVCNYDVETDRSNNI